MKKVLDGSKNTRKGKRTTATARVTMEEDEEKPQGFPWWRIFKAIVTLGVSEFLAWWNRKNG